MENQTPLATVGPDTRVGMARLCCAAATHKHAFPLRSDSDLKMQLTYAQGATTASPLWVRLRFATTSHNILK